MPNGDCAACHGLGSIPMTAHFYTGDVDWEAQCWECFGSDVKVHFPHPRKTDNG
jgi:DnaJ-class molecular chaperone